MHSIKVNKVIAKLERMNKLFQTGIIFWNTLLLPALIAIFVTHLLEVQKDENSSVKLIVWILVVIILLIHAFIIYLQYKGSTIDTMLNEYSEKDQKLNLSEANLNDLKNYYNRDVRYFSSQRKATRFAVDSLSFAIGKLRNFNDEKSLANDADIYKMIHSLIWPLVVFRDSLFSYEAGVKWNIALYSLDEKGMLGPVWRQCDERITPRNRLWEPGFGVVGMSYLHKKIKYYGDISKNNNDMNVQSDIETYRSIIAIPVIACEDESSTSEYHPLGVLLLTSSQPDQFSLDRDAAFLQTYASLLAILLEKVQTNREHSNKLKEVSESEQ